ncbi:MAG: 3-dehydroquinate synthase [Romboutsia sp.]|uniref:3-dehydroquinate synthase n=1 Tax=Romboutsia sp. TaxID=1965302 RepID=UPI003F40E943
MEKIINSVCNVVIDSNYKSFNEAVCYFNECNDVNVKNYEINSKCLKLVNDNKDEEYKDIKNKKNNICDVYDKVLIITDENLYIHQVDKLTKSINSKYLYEYVVKPGEESKTLSIYEEIMNYCSKINLTRKSVIIALGGGVVGDLAGFVASTYMRGIDVIQVPTSLLAQVDSSIGGKTGINLDNIKNIIGSFYQPKFTYINTTALKTLNQEEFISGMAEVIKYAVIYDYKLLDYLIENSEAILNRDENILYNVVKKCSSIKVEVVGKDEKEGGLRKILNFGHTFGHGVEKLCKISHGYAVSIGMNMAFKLALKENLISKDYYDKFIMVSNYYNLPLNFEIPSNKNFLAKDILEIMKSDKKNSFGKMNLILPVELGKVELIDNIEEDKILEIIRECHNA